MSLQLGCKALMAKSESLWFRSSRFPGWVHKGSRGAFRSFGPRDNVCGMLSGLPRPPPSGGSASRVGEPGSASLLHAEHRPGRARRHPRDEASGEEVRGGANAGRGGEEEAGTLDFNAFAITPKPSISQKPLRSASSLGGCSRPGVRWLGSGVGGGACWRGPWSRFPGPSRGPAHHQSQPAGRADRAAGGSELCPGRGHAGSQESRERGRSITTALGFGTPT